ncbi:PREDICTED: non-ltr retroelement reverse mRNAase [Prunus dulcis]|uniref:PREDICTED: non-ltr retroelement reverse mRNAase n=1 Tax=Prunus dulcis TaxID=3755 RepID=A0A5E4G4E4_PRUDU|nr:hypothetical protein L3X38_042947 [Prunus dulcis]VVA34675.1 PREDICTED: non-ltr retroelement reverse mRNAase [Prunus dulcis]
MPIRIVRLFIRYGNFWARSHVLLVYLLLTSPAGCWLLGTLDLVVIVPYLRLFFGYYGMSTIIFSLIQRRSSVSVPEKRWQIPSTGLCKFNVDGALNMSSGTCGVATELYALKFEISFVIDASFYPLVIENNSLSATHFILKDEVCYAAERVLVEDIHHLLASVSSCFVCYVPQTANGVAYRIAHFILS